MFYLQMTPRLALLLWSAGPRSQGVHSLALYQEYLHYGWHAIGNWLKAGNSGVSILKIRPSATWDSSTSDKGLEKSRPALDGAHAPMYATHVKNGIQLSTFAIEQ